MPPFRPTRTAAVLGLCFALGPICAGFLVYKGLLAFKAADRYITVKGLVEHMEQSDRGTFDMRFMVSGNDLPKLYEELVTVTQRVQDFVAKEGFEGQDVIVNAPNVIDSHAGVAYGQTVLSPDRYRIERVITVTSTKVEALQALSGKMSDLISQGVSLTSSNLGFYLDKFNDLRPQLVVEATKNAQKMGEKIAEATGHKLGGIRRVNQGVITILGPNATPDQSWSDTASLMKKIRVLATLEFYIE